MYDKYIIELLALRRKLDDRIDIEIEQHLRERGSYEELKEALEDILHDSRVLCGKIM